MLKKVSDFLKNYDFSRLGVAVSGGADSICLLTAISELVEKEKIFVITVNHNIREESETKGDADFVASYCEKIGVKCEIVTIEKGKVSAVADEREKGIEDAARHLRYEIFSSFIEKNNLDYLCLAHNKNDNAETVLMRVLQGQDFSEISGIAPSREKFIRPLLNCTRSEIENFLNERKITWRTDSTNAENSYLRNRIRNVLVPVLNENFSGWEKAILKGIEKSELSPEEKKLQDEIFDAYKRAGGEKRLPFDVVKEVFKNGKASFDGVEFFLKGGELGTLLANSAPNATRKSSKCGASRASATTTDYSTQNDFYSIIEEGLVVRPARRDDKIASKDGSLRSVWKILENWKIPASEREKVLVVEKNAADGNAKIIAILGKAAGAKEDFIVKN